MITVSISSELAAQAIPVLESFDATLLAMLKRKVLAMTPYLPLQVPINWHEAIQRQSTWQKNIVTPFSHKPEVAFSYYLA
jgi:hypothetical protein